MKFYGGIWGGIWNKSLNFRGDRVQDPPLVEVGALQVLGI